MEEVHTPAFSKYGYDDATRDWNDRGRKNGSPPASFRAASSGDKLKIPVNSTKS
jgi:hypothetical protein